jgi:membrane protease YdiL (CAAX protease family)
MLFAFGLAYATALVCTGSLWATIGLHWGWNMAAFAAGSMVEVVEGRESHAPLLSAGAHLGVACVILVLSPVLAKNSVTEALPASRRFTDENV